ncbi:MAG: hypothetical protein K2Q34_00130 [Alphaproteobacteria bacterium]|nr:hypothetical protein [Alphaproteobacteria bacterium]
MYRTIIVSLCVIFMGLTYEASSSEDLELKSENFALVVMVSKDVGDAFYAELGKPHFKRALWDGDDYHVTVGFVENVSGRDKAAFKSHFNGFLSGLIGEGLNFKIADVGLIKGVFFSLEEIAAASDKLFVPGSAPHVVAVPEDKRPFEVLNEQLAQELSTYLDGKYKLNDLTGPETFVPHITLGARAGVGGEVAVEAVNATLTSLQVLKGRELRLNTILIS